MSNFRGENAFIYLELSVPCSWLLVGKLAWNYELRTKNYKIIR